MANTTTNLSNAQFNRTPHISLQTTKIIRSIPQTEPKLSSQNRLLIEKSEKFSYSPDRKSLCTLITPAHSRSTSIAVSPTSLSSIKLHQFLKENDYFSNLNKNRYSRKNSMNFKNNETKFSHFAVSAKLRVKSIGKSIITCAPSISDVIVTTRQINQANKYITTKYYY